MPGPLGIKDGVELTDEQRCTLQYIEDFDLSEEVAAAGKQAAREAADRGALQTELKRFLALFYLLSEDERKERGPLAPSRIVDPAWHAFILNTRRYHEFCYRVYQDYQHHVPSETGDAGEPLVNAGEFVGRYFEDVDRRIWEGKPRRCWFFRKPKR